MLNTYIKNKGTTKTIIHDNNHTHTNKTNWDADYDGDIANISIDTDINGKSKHFDITLDNNDLANILNVESVNIPINKRLETDFYKSPYMSEPFYIELPTPEFKPIEPPINDMTVDDLIQRQFLSPRPTDNLMPLIGNPIQYTLDPIKRHKRYKRHRTRKSHKKTGSRSHSYRLKKSRRSRL